LFFEPLEARRAVAAATDLASILGTVFDDITGNGLDPGEEVAGATVQLYRDDGDGQAEPGTGDTLVGTQTTNATGDYRFNGLMAGGYFVHQPAQTVGGKTLIAHSTPLTTVSTTAAQGVTVRTIDTFDQTSQSVTDTTNDGTPQTSSTLAPEAIGGERDLRVNKNTATGSIALSANGPLAPGVLAFDTASSGGGERAVVWDGPDGNAIQLDDTGLSGVDLTTGGTGTGFNLAVGADLAGGQATMTVYSNDGNAATANRFSSVSATIPQTGGGAGDVAYIPFSSFTPSGGGADFSSVGAIQLQITGVANVNGFLEAITIVGPTLFTQDLDNFETADLSLTKTVDNAAPNVGSNVTFTVTVNNAGPDAATNVAVRDTLPAGLTFVSSTASQGAYDSGTGIWTMGTINNAANAALQIVARVDDTSVKTNTAQVSASDQIDADSTPNNNLAGEDDQASVTLTPATADLSLTKSVNTATPNLGSNVTFTLTVANAGPNGATNVAVTDILPAGLTFVSSSPGQGTFNSGTGLWTVGSVASGGNASLQITASVDSTGTKTNVAEITASDQRDPDSTPNNNAPAEDDRASITVTPPVADLSLTKTVNTATPNVGQNVTFTITVNNAGPSPAAGVAVTDLLPAGLTFVASTGSQGTYDSGTGLWTIGALPNSGNATLQILARVNTTGVKTNTAQISASDQADPDSTPNNSLENEDDQASISLTPQISDLSLTKTVSEMSPNIGQNVTFTVTVANAGFNAATNVAVTDRLPEGMTFVSSTPSQGSYNRNNGVWTVGTINAGATAMLQILATPTTVGTKTNTAEITASDQFDPDSTPNNNAPSEDDQASVALTPQVADLSVAKTISDTTPDVGSNSTFTITVSNAGPNSATNVSLTDNLPAGIVFVSAAPTQGTYNAGTGIWTVGTISSGGVATLQIIARVDAISTTTNTAQIRASDQFDPDSTPNNNVAGEDDQASITFTPSRADLSLNKTVDTAKPNVGDNVTFTLTVQNDGPDDATGVAVTDRLPTGLTFVSASGSQGSYSSSTGVWTVGSIASGTNATLRIVARVATTGAKTNSAEVTASNQRDPDSTPGNNIPAEDDQASLVVTPQLIDLSLTKTVNDVTPNVQDEVVFTLTVTNAGPDPATGVGVADSLPRGLTFVSATPSQGTYTGSSGIWAVGMIPSGGNATLQLVARVVSPEATTNSAQVISATQVDVDSTPNNNVETEDDQARITVTPLQADLQIVKNVDIAKPLANEEVTFTITVANAGPGNAANVVVADTLPEGMFFVSATPSQGAYDPVTGRWSVGTVNSSALATLQIVAKVTSKGDKTNVAEVVEAAPLDPDSTPDNHVTTEDDQSEVTISPQLADLSITKTVDNAKPQRGDLVMYTVTISNAGPENATNVMVGDQLPPGMSFVMVMLTQGTYNSTTGMWSVGTLNNGATALMMLTASVDTLGVKTNTARVVSVDQFDSDSTPGNRVEAEDDQESLLIRPPRNLSKRLFLSR